MVRAQFAERTYHPGVRDLRVFNETLRIGARGPPRQDGVFVAEVRDDDAVSELQRITLSRMRADGRKVWAIDLGTGTTPSAIAVLDNGDALLTGTVRLASKVAGRMIVAQRGRVTAIAARFRRRDGALMWLTSFQAMRVHATELDDERIYLGGSGPSALRKLQEGRLAAVDLQTGDVVIDVVIPSASAVSAIASMDNTVFTAGWEKKDFGKGMATVTVVTRHSLDGEEDWVRVLGREGALVPRDMLAIAPDRLVIVGSNRFSDYLPAVDSSAGEGFVVELDGEGTLQWARALPRAPSAVARWRSRLVLGGHAPCPSGRSICPVIEISDDEGNGESVIVDEGNGESVLVDQGYADLYDLKTTEDGILLGYGQIARFEKGADGFMTPTKRATFVVEFD